METVTTLNPFYSHFYDWQREVHVYLVTGVPHALHVLMADLADQLGYTVQPRQEEQNDAD